MKPETRNCQNCKNPFIIEPDDFLFYEKIKVPAPTWCWRCRAMRRMAFKNMHHLYKRTCAATGKPIYTQIPPEAPMPAYDHEYWASDAWDPMAYGREYDFSRPFFEQMKELFHAVPWAVMWSMEKVNSEYSVAAWAKNCYLCFDSGYVEDSAYSVTLLKSKSCFDVLNCNGCELCYYSINLNDSYKTFFSRNCTACADVWFSQDCIGCSDCFGCTGLRNKKYYFLNKPHTKEAYKEKLTNMELDSWAGLTRARERAMSIWLSHPVKYRHGVSAKDCTGDYLYNAHRLRNCFFAGIAENLKHCQSVIYGPNKDGMDLTSVEKTELCYEIHDCGSGVYRTFFSHESADMRDSQYSINCRQSRDLFGCVALKNKQHCILNKQYTKREYSGLVSKIIQHMHDMPYRDEIGRTYKYGEFFPPSMSPFGYAESQAHQYFPLTKEEAERMAFNWRKPDQRAYAITRTSKELPERVSAAEDNILKEIIQCEHDSSKGHTDMCEANCATAFRITEQELKFYRQMSLPLPRLCFNCRHFDRVAWRNKPQLWSRKCMCRGRGAGGYENAAKHTHGQHPCPNEFETSYAPNRPEIVYCESCYNSEVV